MAILERIRERFPERNLPGREEVKEEVIEDVYQIVHWQKPYYGYPAGTTTIGVKYEFGVRTWLKDIYAVNYYVAVKNLSVSYFESHLETGQITLRFDPPIKVKVRGNFIEIVT